MSALTCEVCGCDLRREPKRGYLTWWENGAGGTVVALDVHCYGDCAERIERRRAGTGWSEFDGPLDWFTGRWAVTQCWRLLRHYAWSDEAAGKLHDVLVAAAKLRTGGGPPQL
jgi:hypothetical protein